MRRTTITTNLIVAGVSALMAVPASAAAAKPSVPVTQAAAFASATRLADQAAAALEEIGNGAVSIDRSRTSVGNYVSYGRFRKGASFALFGTNTIDGKTRTLWCIGNFEFAAGKGGRIRSTGNVTCPVS